MKSGRGVYLIVGTGGGRGGGGTLGDVTHLSGCSRWQSGSHRTREPEWIGSGRPSADARGRVEGAHAGRRWLRGFENTGNYFKAHLGELHLAHEANAEVLEDDAVGGGEEGKDVLDEVLLVVVELVPVHHVVGEVDLLGCTGRTGGRGK